jgi:hypothetical protein
MADQAFMEVPAWNILRPCLGVLSGTTALAAILRVAAYRWRAVSALSRLRRLVPIRRNLLEGPPIIREAVIAILAPPLPQSGVLQVSPQGDGQHIGRARSLRPTAPESNKAYAVVRLILRILRVAGEPASSRKKLPRIMGLQSIMSACLTLQRR